MAPQFGTVPNLPLLLDDRLLVLGEMKRMFSLVVPLVVMDTMVPFSSLFLSSGMSRLMCDFQLTHTVNIYQTKSFKIVYNRTLKKRCPDQIFLTRFRCLMVQRKQNRALQPTVQMSFSLQFRTSHNSHHRKIHSDNHHHDHNQEYDRNQWHSAVALAGGKRQCPSLHPNVDPTEGRKLASLECGPGAEEPG